MICNQLVQLQESVAALVLADEQHADLEKNGLVRVEDRGAVQAFRQMLEQRITAAGAALSEHVKQHNCAN